MRTKQYIEKLEQEIKDLKDRVYSLEIRQDLWDETFCDRVDNHITNRIYVQVVDNLDNYQKGEKIKEPLRKITRILEDKEGN